MSSVASESPLSERMPSARRKPPTAMVWLARSTALAAAAASGYLLWASLAAAGQVAGCGDSGGPGCSSVLLSRWSSWLGLPVGLPAVVVYSFYFVLLLFIGCKQGSRFERFAWGALLPLATLAAGAALWFCGLQLFALKSVCPYCMAIHACGLALAIFVLRYAPIQWRPGLPRVSATTPPTHQPEASARVWAPASSLTANASSPAPSLTLRASVPAAASVPPLSRTAAGILFLVGLFAVGDLIGGQLAIHPPGPEMEAIAMPAAGASNNPERSAVRAPAEKSVGPVLHRRLGLAGGRATIDTAEVPILGDPYAEWVIAEVFDYTCPECRAMHRRLQGAPRALWQPACRGPAADADQRGVQQICA